MFSLRQLARRSLCHYFRAHLGVLAGATLAAAVLVGALVVGDSVKESLKDRVSQRLGPDSVIGIAAALNTGDRFFSTALVTNFTAITARFRQMPLNFGELEAPDPPGLNALVLPGTAARQDSTARANQVQVYGIGTNFFPSLGWQSGKGPDLKSGDCWLSEALAVQLGVKVADSVVLRVHKPSALSSDAVITPRDNQSVALRVQVARILTDSEGGALSLRANQVAPLNAFVGYDELSQAAGTPGRANLLLARRLRITVAPSRSLQWKVKWRLLWQQGFSVARNSGVSSVPSPLFGTNLLDGYDRIVRATWTLADAELDVHDVKSAPKLTGGEPAPAFAELTTRRIFLEPAVAAAALTNQSTNPTVPILTYLVNSLEHGDDLVPYSMVTAAGPPYTPADLKDDEIVVNDWLAADLHVQPGDTLALAYYRVDAGTQLVEHTNTFRIRSVVPLRGLHADRTLMPEFPGLAKAESTRDWDAGFDLVHPIRNQDEAYWKQWRGTPKAFISLAAGQKMWANRFGDLTAIRWFGTNVPPLSSEAAPSPSPLNGERAGVRGEVTPSTEISTLRDAISAQIRTNLNPADVGLRFTDVRTPALAAAEGGTGQEFGGLMIGFSFFLIISALLLTAMLFSFSLEQRATETGILLALGWEPRRVRRVLFREGFGLAILGTVLGTFGGLAYAKGVLWGLTTLWRDAVNGAGLEFHVTAETIVTGVLSSLAVAAFTLWLTLRKQAKRPARELLNEGANEAALAFAEGGSHWPHRWALVASVAALGMTGTAWATRESGPESFFGAGALMLIAGLLWVRVWLRHPKTTGTTPSFTALALRALSRRPSRSLGTVALLASAAFLIIAVAANRLDANRDATRRDSGTGGFALWAESSLPVIQDLNVRKGQEFYGLDPKSLKDVSVVPFRVRDGDDASCLNLNRAQRPRLLGVKPELLAQRGAFTFSGLAKEVSVTNGWLALRTESPATKTDETVIPAIADANSIQWALQKQLGDTLDYVDERGRPFKVRLIGAVANSILQGDVLIDEAAFVKRFPGESGYRAFLIDAPAASSGALSATLSRALQDTGLEVTPTVRRLDRFNAVQNTYLNTFQMLGGLGLLLGSVGLGVVVLRNVFERRGELALMQAVGFERPALQRLVLVEHAALLVLGLLVGTATALVAVLPTLLTPGAGVPWGALAFTLLAVFLNGALWTWLATRRALRGQLVDSLRAL